MTIREASQLTGVSCDMIRHYEKMGLLSPGRAPNGYRDFADGDLCRIVLIKGFSNLGINLRSLRQLNSPERIAGAPEGHVKELERARAALDAKISMEREMLSCLSALIGQKPYLLLESPGRALYSLEGHPDTFYRTCSELLREPCAFYYYYRITGQRQPAREKGLMFYAPVPATARQMEYLPPHPIYRAMFLSRQREPIGLQNHTAHIEAIRALGYEPVWDILVYHLQEFTEGAPSARLVCADIPIVPAAGASPCPATER